MYLHYVISIVLFERLCFILSNGGFTLKLEKWCLLRFASKLAISSVESQKGVIAIDFVQQ